MKDKTAKILLWSAIVLYILVFTLLCLKKYYAYEYDGIDLGIFNQIFFNTMHGRWYDMTINLNNYFSDHFDLMIVLFTPLYAIWPRPEALLFWQSFILALAAWPLFKIAKLVISQNNTALLVAGLWLVNPFVHVVNMAEFHMIAFAPFFIFWTFYFYKQKRFLPYVIFFLLSLLIREDISLIMLGFFSLTLLDRRDKKWKIFSLLVPIVYFLAALKVVSLVAGPDNYKFFIYYGWLGGHSLSTILWSWITHPLAVIVHILAIKNIIYLFAVLAPLLLIPLYRPKYLWLTVLPLTQFVMVSNGLNSITISSQYVILLLIGIFISFIFGWKKISHDKNIFHQHHDVVRLALAIASIYFLVFLSPIRFVLAQGSDRNIVELKSQAISQIEPGDSVLAEESMLAPLSGRQTIYLDFYAYSGADQFNRHIFTMPEVDKVVMDWQSFIESIINADQLPWLESLRPGMASRWRALMGQYSLKTAQDSVYVFDRGQSNLSLYSLISTTSQPEEAFLHSWKFADGRLALQPNRKKMTGQNYLVRFYRNDGSSFDLALDYAMWPIKDWPDGQQLEFYFYPSEQVNSFQIFSWTGELRLDKTISGVATLNTKEATEKISLW